MPLSGRRTGPDKLCCEADMLGLLRSPSRPVSRPDKTASTERSMSGLDRRHSSLRISISVKC